MTCHPPAACVPPLAPPRASFILSLHADASPCLVALTHPWTVKFHQDGAGEWGYRVSDSPPDTMPKRYSELPLFRPHPSQVCAARARRQFLDRRRGPTDDFILKGGAALDVRPPRHVSTGDFFDRVRQPHAPPSPALSPAPSPQASVGMLESGFQRLASSLGLCPSALLPAGAAHCHA